MLHSSSDYCQFSSQNVAVHCIGSIDVNINCTIKQAGEMIANLAILRFFGIHPISICHPVQLNLHISKGKFVVQLSKTPVQSLTYSIFLLHYFFHSQVGNLKLKMSLKLMYLSYFANQELKRTISRLVCIGHQTCTRASLCEKNVFQVTDKATQYKLACGATLAKFDLSDAVK